MRVLVIDGSALLGIGTIDGFVTHPDGKTFFRINDHWFPADMCELVE